MGYYFTKHYPPYHHREICSMCFYMENSLLQINHKIVHEWANAVLTKIYTAAITPNHTILQGCANFVRT